MHDTELAPVQGANHRPLRRIKAPTGTFLRRHALALLLAFGTFIAALVIRRTWFGFGYSGDADEAVYVLQARMLLHGQLTLPAAQFSGALRPWLTGEMDGRVFTQYLPGWPALLAASQAMTGSMVFAPALVGAAWVLAGYALALELFQSLRIARLTALLLALSPIVLLHSALYLSYAYTAASLAGAAACLLRGARCRSIPFLLSGGALFGIALLARPFDVVLFALPCVAFLVVRERTMLLALLQSLGWAVVGGLPFVAALMAFNERVTGRPLKMPLLASDPLNKFGFGNRRLLPGQGIILYTKHIAYHAMGQNLDGVVSWAFGGVVFIALATIGFVLPRRRLEKLLLCLMVVAFPIGYFFWWGTAMSATGSVNGIGPHYYIPLFVPLAILAAAGVVSGMEYLARLPGLGRLGWVAPLVLLGVATTLTWRAIPPKLATQRYVNSVYAAMKRTLPARSAEQSILVLESSPPSTHTAIPYLFLANGPDLNVPVVYAADEGASGYELGLRYPHRRILRVDPGQLWRAADPFGRRGVTVPLTTTQGRQIELRLRVVNLTRHRHLMSYLYVEGRRESHVLATNAGPGEVFTDSWHLRAADFPTGAALVTVGLAADDSATFPSPERWEEAISVGRAPDGIAAQLPGLPRQRIRFPHLTTWLSASVDSVISVTAVPIP